MFRFTADNVWDSGAAPRKFTLDLRDNELGERDVVVGPGDDGGGAGCVVAVIGNAGI